MGSGLIGFGGLIALLAFFMPWASCAGISISGMDLANQGPARQLGVQLGSQAASLLWLVPVSAALLLLLMLIGVSATAENVGSEAPFALAASAVGAVVTLLVILGILAQKAQLTQSVFTRPVAQAIGLHIGGFVALAGFAIAFLGAQARQAAREADTAT